MTDRAQARFHGRDTGSTRQPVGLDTGRPAREHLSCSATCRCGTSFSASSLSELRDKAAVHMAACDGSNDG